MYSFCTHMYYMYLCGTQWMYMYAHSIYVITHIMSIVGVEYRHLIGSVKHVVCTHV